MERDQITIQILALTSLMMLLIISGCTTADFNPRMFTSYYIYKIDIQSNDPLYNVTFIIPLPVKDGMPVAGNETLTADDFQQPGVSATLTQSPPGLNLTGMVPLQGYQPWFVVLRSDELAQQNESGVVYTIRKNSFIFPNRSTNYRIVPNPIGSESLIVPKFNFSWKDPQVAESQYGNVKYRSYKIPQQTILFAHYQTSPSTRVTVSFFYYGHNLWREGYDDTFINSYQEFFSEQFIGGKNGWYSVLGAIESASIFGGDTWYPNTTDPKWQKFLNQTTI